MSSGFNINSALRVTGVEGLDAAIRTVQGRFRSERIDLEVGLSSRAESSLREVETALKRTGAAAKAAVGDVREFARATSTIRVDDKVSNATNNMSRGMRRLVQDAGAAALAVERVKSQAELAGEAFGATARRFGVFLVVSHGFNSLAGAIGDSVKQAVNFQHEMTRLSQIGGTSASAIADVQKEISRIATTMGASSQALAEVSVTLRQAGLTAGEVKTALEALAKTSLAPTFESLKSTTEGVIALRQQFGVTAADFEKRLGSINTVAGEFAVESEDIVTAIKKAGGAFRAAAGDLVGNEQAFNQFISLFTSVRDTTRESADEISTGLRTIFARVQSNSVANALKEMGVELRFSKEEARQFGQEVEGRFVGAYEAVRRLSEATKNIPTTDPRYAQIVEQLGGFRQISRVIPLLQQFGTAQRAYTTAQAGANSLSVDAAKAQDSLIVKTDKLKESLAELVRTFGDNKGIRTMIESTLELATALVQLTQSLEPVVPLLAVIGGAKLFSGLRDFGRGAVASFKQVQDRGPVRRRKGGVVPGTGRGDHVPIDGQQGDFVINRAASRAIGYDVLEDMRAGRFQAGGPLRKTIPVLAEPEEFYFTAEEARRIGPGALEHMNRTGSLDPRHRLAMKIKAMGGMNAMYTRKQAGGEITLEEFRKKLGPEFAAHAEQLFPFYNAQAGNFQQPKGAKATRFGRVVNQSLIPNASGGAASLLGLVGGTGGRDELENLMREINGRGNSGDQSYLDSLGMTPLGQELTRRMVANARKAHAASLPASAPDPDALPAGLINASDADRTASGRRRRLYSSAQADALSPSGVRRRLALRDAAGYEGGGGFTSDEKDLADVPSLAARPVGTRGRGSFASRSDSSATGRTGLGSRLRRNAGAGGDVVVTVDASSFQHVLGDFSREFKQTLTSEFLGSAPPAPSPAAAHQGPLALTHSPTETPFERRRREALARRGVSLRDFERGFAGPDEQLNRLRTGSAAMVDAHGNPAYGSGFYGGEIQPYVPGATAFEARSRQALADKARREQALADSRGSNFFGVPRSGFDPHVGSGTAPTGVRPATGTEIELYRPVDPEEARRRAFAQRSAEALARKAESDARVQAANATRSFVGPAPDGSTPPRPPGTEIQLYDPSFAHAQAAAAARERVRLRNPAYAFGGSPVPLGPTTRAEDFILDGGGPSRRGFKPDPYPQLGNPFRGAGDGLRRGLGAVGSYVGSQVDDLRPSRNGGVIGSLRKGVWNGFSAYADAFFAAPGLAARTPGLVAGGVSGGINLGSNLAAAAGRYRRGDLLGTITPEEMAADRRKAIAGRLNVLSPAEVERDRTVERAGVIGRAYYKADDLVQKPGRALGRAASAVSRPFSYAAGQLNKFNDSGFGRTVRAGTGAVAAASILTDYIGGEDARGDTVEALERSRGSRVRNAGVTFAAAGYQAGALTGIPGGAVIGAVVGGLYGLANAVKTVNREIGQIKLDESLKRLGRVIDDVAQGRTSTSEFASRTNSFVRQVRADSLESVGPASLSWGDWARERFSGTGSDSSFEERRAALSEVYRRQETANVDNLSAKEREVLTPLLPSMMQAFQSSLLKGGTITADMVAVGGDVDEQRKNRRAAILDNGGGELIETVARVQKSTFDEAFSRVERELVQAARAQNVDRSTLKSGDLLDADSRRFEALGQALESATQAVRGFQNEMDAIEGLAGGRTFSAAPSGFVDRAKLIGGVDPSAVTDVTSFLSGSLKGSGGGILRGFSDNLKEMDEVRRSLPSLLTEAARGGDYSEEGITGNLSKAFSGFSKGTQTRLQTKLDTMDPKTVLQELTSNPEKLAENLASVFDPVSKSVESITSQIQGNFARYGSGLERGRSLQNQAEETGQGVVEAGVRRTRLARQYARTRFFRDPGVDLGSEFAPFRSRQAALTRSIGGSQDPDAIGRRLAEIEGQALTRRGFVNNPKADQAARKEAQKALVDLSDESAKLQQALRGLADSSDRVATIQEKIAEVEKSRESQLGLVERLLTGDPSANRDFSKGLTAARIAGEQGDFSGFSAKNARLALESLRSFGDASFKDGPFAGQTGNEAAQRLLAGSSLSLGPMLKEFLGTNLSVAGPDRELAGLFGRADSEIAKGGKATAVLSSYQDARAKSFFDRLEQGFDGFFSNADRTLAESAAKDARSTSLAADSELQRRRSDQGRLAAINSEFDLGTGNGLSNARRLNASTELPGFASSLSSLSQLTAAKGRPLDLSKAGLGLAAGEGAGAVDADEFLKKYAPRLDAARSAVFRQAGLPTDVVDDASARFRADVRARINGEGGLKGFDAEAQFRGSLDSAVGDAQKKYIGQVESGRTRIAYDVFGRSSGAIQSKIDEVAGGRDKFSERLQGLDRYPTLESANEAVKSQAGVSKESADRLAAALADLTKTLKDKAVPVAAKSAGGTIFNPKGADSVPTILAPGERVVPAGGGVAQQAPTRTSGPSPDAAFRALQASARSLDESAAKFVEASRRIESAGASFNRLADVLASNPRMTLESNSNHSVTLNMGDLTDALKKAVVAAVAPRLPEMVAAEFQKKLNALPMGT